MNELPSSSSGMIIVDNFNLSLEDSEAEALPVVEMPAVNAEIKAREDELERQATLESDERERKLERRRQRHVERERQVQARMRAREREMRLQRMQNDNLIRPPRPYLPMEDPYDSSESGYWSIRDRRPQTRTEKMWAKVAAEQRRIEARKAKEKEKEDKQELDAMFHVMLHGCGSDDLCVSDCEYEYKLPAFLRFDEIKRGFDEQMKKEKADREARLAREEKERQMAAFKPKEEKKTTPCNGCCSHPDNTFKCPPANADWNVIKAEVKKLREQKVIIVNNSSDEDEEMKEVPAISDVKWASCSSTVTRGNSTATTSSASTSSTASCSMTKPINSVIIVHDSDSDSD